MMIIKEHIIKTYLHTRKTKFDIGRFSKVYKSTFRVKGTFKSHNKRPTYKDKNVYFLMPLKSQIKIKNKK